MFFYILTTNQKSVLELFHLLFAALIIFALSLILALIFFLQELIKLFFKQFHQLFKSKIQAISFIRSSSLKEVSCYFEANLPTFFILILKFYRYFKASFVQFKVLEFPFQGLKYWVKDLEIGLTSFSKKAPPKLSFTIPRDLFEYIIFILIHLLLKESLTHMAYQDDVFRNVFLKNVHLQKFFDITCKS